MDITIIIQAIQTNYNNNSKTIRIFSNANIKHLFITDAMASIDMKIRGHLDLFSGIGGFSLGLREAGVHPKWVGFSDIDKYANETYQRRFPDAEKIGPIENVLRRAERGELPKIDLVTFGFPCQDLSIAGRGRKGFKGTRSSLFFEAIEIIRLTRPKYFVFENVKGFFSSNNGKDFTIALQTIADIGYDGGWQLLNTRWFPTTPQNRERIYFVGHIRGECRPEVFPIGESIELPGESQKEKEDEGSQYCSTITSNYRKGVHASGETYIADFRNDEGLRVRKNGMSPCLPARRHSETDPSTMPPLILTDRVRRLTPREAEKLQGFPVDWTDGQSDTQRYKQLGNAVSVTVVKEVMSRLWHKNEKH